MEKEYFFSGYCRQIDNSRTVAVVTENNTLTEVDCCYESCVHALNCMVGQKISDLLER